MIVGLADSCSEEEVGVMRSYVDATRIGGHLPLVLPATTVYEEACRQLMAVDALMLLGGGDVEASRFGSVATPFDGTPNVMRDAYELLLMQVAVEQRKPVFGICRGLQLINIFFGGTICQDLPTCWSICVERSSNQNYSSTDYIPLLDHSRPDKKWEPVHAIHIDAQSRLAQVLGETQVSVNSTHHQAVDRLGSGLRAVAWSADGVIEAVESDNYPIAAVQFHPERLAWGDDTLFRKIFADLPRYLSSHCS